jgi:protein-S-isoprenylcysteine O-methyltransferase Ste14
MLALAQSFHRFMVAFALFVVSETVRITNELKYSNSRLGMLMRSERGNIGAAVTAVIGVIVVLYVLAFLAPGALEALMDVDTTGWDGPVAGIWSVLIILVVIALLYLIWKFVESRRTG